MKNEWHSHIKPVGEFDSKFEKSIYDQLKSAGLDVVREPRPLTYGPCRYYPDFGIKTKGGKEVFIEAKGWLNTKAAEKMRRVKFWNDRADIRIVFQNGNTKVGRLKSCNLQWAKRNRYPASEKEFPQEWIDEFLL